MNGHRAGPSPQVVLSPLDPLRHLVPGPGRPLRPALESHPGVIDGDDMVLKRPSFIGLSSGLAFRLRLADAG